MVVGQVVGHVLCRNRTNQPPLHVDRLDCRLDKTRSAKRRADRLSAMAEFQPARARLEKQRCDDEEVLTADERDLDVWTKQSLEMTCRRHTTPSSTEHDQTHVPSSGFPFGWLLMA